MAEQRRVTSADVAREAGVSRTTVSFVLNGTATGNISPATQQRVLDAADRLGYTPSAAGRALRRGHSEVVLCLMPAWPIHTAAGDYLQQLSLAFSACGFTFVVHPHTPTNPLDEVWKRLRPAAVLAFDDLADRERSDTERAGIPIVTVSLTETNEKYANVGAYTNDALGRLQAQHLIEKGHLRIGYAAPDNHALDYFTESRLHGVRQVLARAALPEPVVLPVALTAESAVSAVRIWRGAAAPVTAVCAFNDEVALAVLAAAHGSQVAVPDDLAIIGIDDIPAAALAMPPLTTVRRSMTDMARQTAEVVLHRLKRPQPRWWNTPAAAEVVQRSTT